MEVGVSKSELCHPFVQEGFDKYGEGFEDDEDEEDEEHLSIEIAKQEAEIMELRKAMEEFKAIFNDTSNKILKQEVPAEPHNYGGQEDFDEYGQEERFEVFERTPPQQHAEEVGANIQRDEGQSSNLYHRLKEEPGQRFKSIAIRTPFMTYARRRKRSS